MPRKRKKRNGVGASCRCLKRFLHPRQLVDAKYPNATQQERLGGLVTIRREEKQVNRAQKWCIIFRHDDFPDRELHCSERYAVVETEGAEADFFQQVEVQDNQAVQEGAEEQGAIETPNIGAGSDLQDDINRLRQEGYGVDDDNEPAPENVPFNDPPPLENEPPPPLFGDWESQHLP